jgi:ParB-like chromosome segregation protein Spo0J
MKSEFLESLKEKIATSDNPVEVWNDMRRWIAEASGMSAMPVATVLWVPIDRVTANDYNPNSVARTEMRLLYTSIAHDGLTQPVVTIYDAENDVYVIVDGFHRFTTLRRNPDLLERTGGLLPVVVIDKPINDRMASTVRHNRARGKHSITGMASMVFAMLENGWEDVAICDELGMEADELLRLKHITGFSKLFANVKYQKAWQTKHQIKLKAEHVNA